MKGKNQKNLKEENTATLLRLVREKPYISRIDVVRLTDLTPPTVSRIIAFLIENGVVSERVSDTKNIGRKPFSLRFEGKSFEVIAIEISYTFIKFAILDLEGNIKKVIKVDTDTQISNKHLESILLEHISNLKQEYKNAFAIGVSSPGRVDPKNGVIISIPNLRNLSFFDINAIGKKTNLPIFILNDANAEALAEMYFGEGHDVNDFLLLHIGFGVGGGVVINKKLYNGNFGVSGEIGHISIDSEHGLKCDCGNIGCVELYANYNIMLKEIKEKLQDNNLSEESILKLLKNGNSVALDVVKRKGNLIGQMLVNVVNMFAPEKIVLAGPVIEFSDFIIPPIKDTLAKHSFYGFGRDIKIVPSKLKENTGLIGAMSVVLEEFLDHPYRFIPQKV